MMHLGVVLAFAAQVSVPHVPMHLPSPETTFKTDNPSAATFFAGHPVPNAVQFTRMADMACVVWGRTTANSWIWNCRAKGQAEVTPSLGPGFDGNLYGFVQNDIHEIIFLPNNNTVTLGMSLCGVPLGFNECDYWINSAAGIPWGTRVAPPGTPGGFLSWRGSSQLARPGAIDVQPTFGPIDDMYRTMLHETGHMHGLNHAQMSGTSNPCDAVNYDCPVMSNPAGRQVSYYPQLDEILSGWDRTWENDTRPVWATTYEMNTSGVLVQTSNWVQMSGVTSTRVIHVSCKPDQGSSWPNGGNSSCILATHNPGEAPKFYPIHTGYKSVTVGAAQSFSTSLTSEFGVDVAYGRVGGVNRLVGVGKRPVTTASGTRLVLYTGTVGGAISSGLTPVASSLRTHTEPRVSFHETANVFVLTWVDVDGRVRVASVNELGAILSIATLFDTTNGQEVMSAWPAEVACDSHLFGSQSTCRVFALSYGGHSTALSFRALSMPITIHSDGTISNIGGLASVTPSVFTNAGLLLNDAATYGNGFIAGEQYGQASFMINQDRLREFGLNPVSVSVDRGGDFAPADVTLQNFPMAGNGSPDLAQTNMSTWDWDETSAQWIVFRTSAS